MSIYNKKVLDILIARSSASIAKIQFGFDELATTEKMTVGGYMGSYFYDPSLVTDINRPRVDLTFNATNVDCRVRLRYSDLGKITYYGTSSSISAIYPNNLTNQNGSNRLQRLFIENGINVTSLDVSQCTELTTIVALKCNITNIRFNNNEKLLNVNLLGANNLITDALIEDLVNNGLTNGKLQIQRNPVSGKGNGYKNTLINRGWTITVGY